MPDAIEHGKSGLLVDPEKPTAIAEAVISLLSDPETAARMGQYGRRRAIERFDWSSRGRAVARIIET